MSANFQTSLFGFSKKQVLAHLEGLAATHQNDLNTLRTEWEQTGNRNEQLRQQITALELQVRGTSEKDDRQKKRVDTLETIVKRLIEERDKAEEEISRLRKVNLGNSNRIAELQLQTHTLQRKLDEAEDRLEQETGSAQNIGEILAEAQRLSGQLQQEAQAKAEQILNSAQNSAVEIHTDLIDCRMQVVEAAEILSSAMQELQAGLGQLDKIMNSLDKAPLQTDSPVRELPLAQTAPKQIEISAPISAESSNSERSDAVDDWMNKVKEWLK